MQKEDNELFRKMVGQVKPLKQKKNVGANNIRPRSMAKKRSDEYSQGEYYSPLLALSDNYAETLSAEDKVSYQAPDIGLSPQLIRKIQRGEYLMESQLDLHGESIETARDKLSFVLQQAHQEQKQGVLIIHGKGRQAMLKNHVVHWLKQIPWVLFFCSAQPKEGGAGALYVLLKKKKTKENLLDVRKKIDTLDNQITQLLMERFICAKKAAQLKKTAHLDVQREQEILERVSSYTNKHNIPGELMKEIYQAILSQMRKYQTL